MAKTRAILKIRSYKDGRLLLEADDFGVRTLLKDVVELCEKRHGGWVRVDMSPPRRNRTLPMNSKWWAMCTEYGNHCGMSKDDVALGVKYRAMEEGLWQGEDVPFSKSERKRPKSTAEADVEEMSTLIDVLYRIAAEDGYVFDE